MKMKEEQDALKEETDTMKGKTAELSEDKLNHVVGGFGTGEVVVTSYSFNVGDWFEDWNMSFIVTETITGILGHVLVHGIEFRTSRGPGVDQHPAAYEAERLAGWTYNGPYPGDYSPIDYENPAQYQ